MRRIIATCVNKCRVAVAETNLLWLNPHADAVVAKLSLALILQRYASCVLCKEHLGSQLPKHRDK